MGVVRKIEEPATDQYLTVILPKRIYGLCCIIKIVMLYQYPIKLHRLAQLRENVRGCGGMSTHICVYVCIYIGQDGLDRFMIKV